MLVIDFTYWTLSEKCDIINLEIEIPERSCSFMMRFVICLCCCYRNNWIFTAEKQLFGNQFGMP